MATTATTHALGFGGATIHRVELEPEASAQLIAHTTRDRVTVRSR
jgi:hypothetical protein